jgi:hypothetical protein
MPPPPDEIKSFVMLLRNMDYKAEFRMAKVEGSRTYANCIYSDLITGSNKRERVFIARNYLKPNGRHPPLLIKRCQQFPAISAVAMTTTTSQWTIVWQCGNSSVRASISKWPDLCCADKRKSRSQWPRGVRRRSTAARLLGLRVRIPQGAWMSISCECCVLSGRGLCDGLITRLEESYRMWCV